MGTLTGIGSKTPRGIGPRVLAATLTAIAILVVSARPADAWRLYHATSRTAARSIAARGFKPAKMSAAARNGRGVYLTSGVRAARLEKPRAGSVVVFRGTRGLKRRTVDLTRLSSGKMKRLSGDHDLRGNIKRGVIGPKLSRRLGAWAGRTDHALAYRSARASGRRNVFIPRMTYARHPRLLRLPRAADLPRRPRR